MADRNDRNTWRTDQNGRRYRLFRRVANGPIYLQWDDEHGPQQPYEPPAASPSAGAGRQTVSATTTRPRALSRPSGSGPRPNVNALHNESSSDDGHQANEDSEDEDRSGSDPDTPSRSTQRQTLPSAQTRGLTDDIQQLQVSSRGGTSRQQQPLRFERMLEFDKLDTGVRRTPSRLRAVLDTGCTPGNFIPLDFVRVLGFPVTRSDETFRSVTSHPIHVVGTVLLTYKTCGRAIETRFFVAQDMPLTLGRPEIARHPWLIQNNSSVAAGVTRGNSLQPNQAAIASAREREATRRLQQSQRREEDREARRREEEDRVRRAGLERQAEDRRDSTRQDDNRRRAGDTGRRDGGRTTGTSGTTGRNARAPRRSPSRSPSGDDDSDD